MKIALVSLNQIWEEKEKNLALCEENIKVASKQNVELIIFPEMTLTGFSNNIEKNAEDKNYSVTIDSFSDLAKKYSIAIVFGVVIKNESKALNKLIFVNKNGQVVNDYIKIHPFSFAEEDKYFDSGNKLSVVKMEDINIGLSICYDLRFPEIYSALTKNSDLIINVANWPAKRVNHWNTLLKARAIENQIFIAGVNRIERDGNGLEYIESSNIFNADGEELEFNKIDDMKIYEIDRNWTKEFKKKFNTINDRKVDFYKEIL